MEGGYLITSVFGPASRGSTSGFLSLALHSWSPPLNSRNFELWPMPLLLNLFLLSKELFTIYTPSKLCLGLYCLTLSFRPSFRPQHIKSLNEIRNLMNM